MPYAAPPKPPILRLAQHFASLKDPRVAGRTEHPLLTVVVMALVGVLSGAEGWDDLEEIARDREAWFARLVDMLSRAAQTDRVGVGQTDPRFRVDGIDPIRADGPRGRGRPN